MTKNIKQAQGVPRCTSEECGCGKPIKQINDELQERNEKDDAALAKYLPAVILISGFVAAALVFYA